MRQRRVRGAELHRRRLPHDGDCTTGYCSGAFLSIGVCRVTLCDDGVRDNDETDVDCGGHCGGCVLGQASQSDSDCALHSCTVSCPAGGACTGVCT